MKRPFLDQLATSLFQLERKRVESSSVLDDKGRIGEPMEWSEESSLANRFSEVMAGGIGYQLKQFVADIVAGNNFDRGQTRGTIQRFITENKVAMFSFTTCPFCRRAKDYLTEQGIPYAVLELDQLPNNEGNEIRSVLGRQVKRTSVPCIFINGKFIGGCNDGPGLLPLAKTGELQILLKGKK
jgi:glutaredoxin 3